MMSEIEEMYEFDAPRYCDFEKISTGTDIDEGVDRWFDDRVESCVTAGKPEAKEEPAVITANMGNPTAAQITTVEDVNRPPTAKNTNECASHAGIQAPGEPVGGHAVEPSVVTAAQPAAKSDVKFYSEPAVNSGSRTTNQVLVPEPPIQKPKRSVRNIVKAWAKSATSSPSRIVASVKRQGTKRQASSQSVVESADDSTTNKIARTNTLTSSTKAQKLTAKEDRTGTSKISSMKPKRSASVKVGVSKRVDVAVAASAECNRKDNSPRSRVTGSCRRSASMKKASVKATLASANTRTPPKQIVWTGKITKPETPNVMKRTGASKLRMSTGPIKSSEELELEKIEQARQEAKRARKLSDASFKRMSASKFEPMRSDKPLTKAEEFSFAARDAEKASKATKSLDEATVRPPVDTLPSAPSVHGMLLRGTQRSVYQAAGKTTKAVPFNFKSRMKKAISSAGTPFVAVAQQVQKFVSTPKRCKGQGKPGETFKPLPFEQRSLTVPVAPSLQTTARAINLAPVQSTIELEVAMMQDRKPFKATPINARVMESCGDYGVPVIASKATTEAIGFSQLENHHKMGMASKSVEAIPTFSFKAQPGPSGLVAEASTSRLTADPRASRGAVKFDDDKVEVAHTFRAKVRPKTTGFVPKKSTKGLTEVTPFELNTRSRAAIQ